VKPRPFEQCRRGKSRKHIAGTRGSYGPYAFEMASDRDERPNPFPLAPSAVYLRRPAQMQRPLSHRAQAEVSGEIALLGHVHVPFDPSKSALVTDTALNPAPWFLAGANLTSPAPRGPNPPTAPAPDHQHQHRQDLPRSPRRSPTIACSSLSVPLHKVRVLADRGQARPCEEGRGSVLRPGPLRTIACALLPPPYDAATCAA
jgi:hypothetical protein